MMLFCFNNNKNKNHHQHHHHQQRRRRNDSSSSSSSSTKSGVGGGYDDSSSTSLNSNSNSRTLFLYRLILYGNDYYYSKRKLLLLLALIVNVFAIISLSVAAIAIQTSDKLTKVGWAKAGSTTIVSNTTTTTNTNTTTNLLFPIQQQCFINDNNNNNESSSIESSISISIEVNVWLGLKGYYGQCTAGKVNNGELKESSTIHTTTNTTTSHSDKFCSPGSSTTTTSSNSSDSDNDVSAPIPINNNFISNISHLDDIIDLFDINNNNNNDIPGIHSNDFQCGGQGNQQQNEEDSLFITCELITDAKSLIYDDDNNTTSILINPYDNPNCTACKDTSRNCVATLLSAVVFGIFPLILTIRRYCETKRDLRLRLRTMIFGFLAIILGLHAFHKFHYECVKIGMPTSFSIEICIYPSSSCNTGNGNGDVPFLIQVPMQFKLHAGAKLVIMGAILKFAYVVLHFITPVVNNNNTNTQYYETIPDNHNAASCDDQQQPQPSSTTFRDEYDDDLNEEELKEQQQKQKQQRTQTQTTKFLGYVV